MPRRTHPTQHHGKKRRPLQGRSHSHIKIKTEGKPGGINDWAQHLAFELVRAGRVSRAALENPSTPLAVAPSIPKPAPVAPTPAPPTAAGPRPTPVPKPTVHGDVPHRDEHWSRIDRPELLCTRHKRGNPNRQPCWQCEKLQRRAGYCWRHPDGDTGEPCGICQRIKNAKTQTKGTRWTTTSAPSTTTPS